MRTDRHEQRKRHALTALKLAYRAAVILLLALCLIRLDNLQIMATDELNQSMEIRRELDKPEPGERPMESLGTFKISHYDICQECCGKTDGVTASGTVAEVGRTVGVDTDVIPFGTVVVINGHEYIAEDTGGGIKGKRIDVLVGSHSEAIELGVYEAEVYVKWKK